MHVDEATLPPVRARFGVPIELRWGDEISDVEWAIATHNPARTHDVTLFILDPSRRLALIRKPHFAEDVWRPPGGGIHPGEDFVAGAVREALEETGLQVELRRYLVDARALAHARLPRGDGGHGDRGRRPGRDRRRPVGHARRARRAVTRAPARDRARVLALPRRAARCGARCAQRSELKLHRYQVPVFRRLAPIRPGLVPGTGVPQALETRTAVP
jgi:hypothetical protein